MTDPSSSSLVDKSENSDNQYSNINNNGGLLDPDTSLPHSSRSSSTLSTSRPRSYGTIAVAVHPRVDASPASPCSLAPRTVGYTGPDDAAPDPRHQIRSTGEASQLARNTTSSTRQLLSNVDFDTDFDTDIDTDPDSEPVVYAGLDGNMPPQTAFLSGSNRRLAIAYGGLLLVAFTTSLEAQVTAPLAAFAVSSFQNHSLLSTVYVVQGVVNGMQPFLFIFNVFPLC